MPVACPLSIVARGHGGVNDQGGWAKKLHKNNTMWAIEFNCCTPYSLQTAADNALSLALLCNGPESKLRAEGNDHVDCGQTWETRFISRDGRSEGQYLL